MSISSNGVHEADHLSQRSLPDPDYLSFLELLKAPIVKQDINAVERESR